MFLTEENVSNRMKYAKLLMCVCVCVYTSVSAYIKGEKEKSSLWHLGAALTFTAGCGVHLLNTNTS